MTLLFMKKKDFLPQSLHTCNLPSLKYTGILIPNTLSFSENICVKLLNPINMLKTRKGGMNKVRGENKNQNR